MSTKKFVLVTTALMGLCGASAAFASDAREEIENMNNKISNLNARIEIIKQNREKNAVERLFSDAVMVPEDYSFEPYGLNFFDSRKRENFAEEYNKKVLYNKSWNTYFKDSIISASKYVVKVFGGLFY